MSKAKPIEVKKLNFNYMQNWQIEKLCIDCVARVKVTFYYWHYEDTKYFALLSNNFQITRIADSIWNATQTTMFANRKDKPSSNRHEIHLANAIRTLTFLGMNETNHE